MPRAVCACAPCATLTDAEVPPPHIIAQVPVRAGTLVDMRRIGDIHTFEDRALQRWMTRASFAVLSATAALSVGLMVALGACAPGALDRPLAGVLGIVPLSWFALCGWFAAFAVTTFALLAVHELVHAALFKLFAPRGVRITFGANWKVGMLYACAEGIVYTRRQYLVIALGPSVAVTAAVLACATAAGCPVLAVGIAGVHLCGCTGDWYYVRTILRNPAVTHCEDTTWGMRLFGAGEGTGADDADEKGAAA